ncbi:aspartate aminotransferase family protein [Mariluticola halotolerans]|uniref:aspartate aminotransferase family protein n=1 Tax=Mariluticola halotolerans TaxID=2909283 RepID=UPI0026E2391C|nr:aspartate aminotransferase family protein [Mariluticola halotolerans]UJQ95686.1 aspartate aminotransferase family protein [Mariluticola halotolerans]
MASIDNHLSTAELQALDAAHHLHPFTDSAALNKKGARVITRAEGVYLTDSEGLRLLDGMAGLWCVNIGYGRAELGEVAQRQMNQLPYYNTFFQTSHPPAITLAAKLAELAPGDLNHVFYAGSGSEANDTNLRMVRHYWASQGKPEKSIIISRKNAYHGSSVGSGSLGGMTGIHAQGGMPIPGIVHIDQPYWYREGGDLSPEEFGLERARQLELEIERLGEENVAAFIAEPIQGAGGVIIPPATYWPEIQRICDAHEILLIVDEVITGFGRTGKWFGTEFYDLKPDIVTIAKGLSSGYLPIGGSLVSDRMIAGLEAAGEFAHGYTFSGHPVTCAVALENLRILEDEKIVERVETDTAPYLQKRWAELGDHPLVGEARMVGLMGALELTPDKSARAKFAADEGTVGLIGRETCFGNGLVMRHVGDKMILSPPLVINHEEIDALIELAVKSLDETHAAAKAQGLMVAG